MRSRLAPIVGLVVLLLAVALTVGGIGPLASDDAPAPAAAKPVAVDDGSKSDAASKPDAASSPRADRDARAPEPTKTPRGANAAEAARAAETAKVAAAGALEVAVGRAALPAVEIGRAHV